MNRKGLGDDMNFNLQEMIMFTFLIFRTKTGFHKGKMTWYLWILVKTEAQSWVFSRTINSFLSFLGQTPGVVDNEIIHISIWETTISDKPYLYRWDNSICFFNSFWTYVGNHTNLQPNIRNQESCITYRIEWLKLRFIPHHQWHHVQREIWW